MRNFLDNRLGLRPIILLKTLWVVAFLTLAFLPTPGALAQSKGRSGKVYSGSAGGQGGASSATKSKTKQQKSTVHRSKSVAKSPKPTVKKSKSVAKSPKPTVKKSKSVAKSPKPTAKKSKSVASPQPGKVNESAGNEVMWESSTVIAKAGDAPKKIRVELLVIHASNKTKGYDPKVKRFKRHLSILSYSGFKLLNEEGFDLKLGQTHKTALIEGKVIETTMVSGTDEKVRLNIKLSAPTSSDPLVNTKVSVPRNGTFFVGGPKYDGGVLIFPVTAQY